MSIFVTGDTHGSQSRGLISRDGFISRLSTSAFPEQRALSKDDFVVICGDFGGVWETSRFSVQESKSEKYALDWLEERSFTTLFVPGNHENYDRLTGCHDEKLLGLSLQDGLKSLVKSLHDVAHNTAIFHVRIVEQLIPLGTIGEAVAQHHDVVPAYGKHIEECSPACIVHVGIGILFSLSHCNKTCTQCKQHYKITSCHN